MQGKDVTVFAWFCHSSETAGTGSSDRAWLPAGGAARKNLPAILVVGFAGDGSEAVARAGSLRPDVILMDVEMPGIDGFEATRQIKSHDPVCRVNVLRFLFGMKAPDKTSFRLEKTG